ncbi:hypothetical protein, partial [Enterobacter hormaechei]|uniref:hypothetical protein n=1 Tax=Enterobacter hormaechei TaxID=158836 RepID=UPI001C3ED854
QNWNSGEDAIAASVGRRLIKCKNNCCTLCAICGEGKSRVLRRDLNVTIKLAINIKTGHL